MKEFLRRGVAVRASFVDRAPSAQLVPEIPDDWRASTTRCSTGRSRRRARRSGEVKELEAYDELVYGYPSLTEAQITSTYFKDGAFRR